MAPYWLYVSLILSQCIMPWNPASIGREYLFYNRKELS